MKRGLERPGWDQKSAFGTLRWEETLFAARVSFYLKFQNFSYNFSSVESKNRNFENSVQSKTRMRKTKEILNIRPKVKKLVENKTRKKFFYFQKLLENFSNSSSLFSGVVKKLRRKMHGIQKNWKKKLILKLHGKRENFWNFPKQKFKIFRKKAKFPKLFTFDFFQWSKTR